MTDNLYLSSIDLNGKNGPSWTSIPNDIWRTILKDFFFKLSDSFAFMNVTEKEDLFPVGLRFFENWDLESSDLVELDGNMFCKFKLNENCKLHLLNQDFSVHQTGMPPMRNYCEFDEEHYYYEFDELYFISTERIIGVFINHEDTIQFKNLNETEMTILHNLDQKITSDIIDELDFQKHIQSKTKS